MSDPKPKKPLTIKSLLALVAAGVVYLVSQALGIDLTGKSAAPEDDAAAQGAPTAPAPPAGQPPTGQPPAGQPATSEPPSASEPPPATAPRRDDSKLIAQLSRTMVSDRIVEAEGEVVHILPLDTKGTRHQNFLVELSTGVTVKVSHNIDLAPAIPNLEKRTSIRFHGEYEWNDKGGVVHWTHHDPARRHEGGWLEYRGQRYE